MSSSTDATHEPPVIVDFMEASNPKSDVAQRIAADAMEIRIKLSSPDGKKAGLLRGMSTTRSESFTINPYLIQIRSGWNSREPNSPENLEHIDTLARSISQIGVQSPLTVVLDGDNTFVIDGHCRLLATFRAIEVYGAEIRSVPVRVESRLTTPADHVLRQLLTGKPLSVVEQGNAFVKLTNFGWSSADIALKSGLSEIRVNQILDFMAGSSDALRDLVVAGKVSANTVVQVLRDTQGDTSNAEDILIEAVEEAKSEGKKKATLKHARAVSGEVRAPLKSTLKTILGSKNTRVDTSGDDDKVIITMNIDDWRKMAELLKI